MDGWQPARYREAHKFSAEDYLDGEFEPAEVEMSLIYVRPVDPLPENLAYYRRYGCNAERFYEVRGDHGTDSTGNLVCEHEILTD